MSKRNLLIHIGMPKAGSTTLQRQVFPKTKKYRYLGKDDGLNDQHLMPIFNFIGDLAYITEDELTASFILFDTFLKSEEIKRFGDINSEIPILLSFETFTTLLFQAMNYHIGVYGADPYKIFSRLKEFGTEHSYNIDIILIERNEKEAIHSWYAQYFYHYRSIMALSNLKGMLTSELNLGYMQLGLKWYLKGKLMGVLCEYFNQTNIHVFQFEALFSYSKTTDQEKFNKLIGVNFDPTSFKAENKRKLIGKNNIKIGSNRSPHKFSLGFTESLKIAINTFKDNYYSNKKLEIPIAWDEECDHLLNKIIEKESKKFI
ncbi:hypothetical protein [Aequorivita capsosiphonis]|uniref:hypothetical protein n=1 Tax=Aequorivita capsosiphonis TaxID=487317 RepID=UPI000412F043|nr:hypothetical protein [Aequorivita capsosiphonis]